MEQKYVRLEEYDEIIIFPEPLQHSAFKHLEPVSAGFCIVGNDVIKCYGRSASLGLEGKDDDSFIATKQVFGWEAAEAID